jgi:hypothetical protein
MPDIDPFAFSIRLALTHETLGREAKKVIRSLSERDFEHLSMQVAKHLRLCGWRQLPPRPLATGDQFPAGGRGDGDTPNGTVERRQGARPMSPSP